MKTPRWFNVPKFWVWFHGVFIIFWIFLWIAATVFGWVNSVMFISHLSIVALILASMASWQGARTEEKEEENK